MKAAIRLRIRWIVRLIDSIDGAMDGAIHGDVVSLFLGHRSFSPECSGRGNKGVHPG